MIITAVERKRGPQGRVRIYIDGQPALEIPGETARKRDLHPGRTIAPDELAAISAAEARRDAFDTAARMLARRQHSEREIRRRLSQRRVAPELVDETVARLTAMRAIDDVSFAHAYAETRDRTSPRGARVLIAELRAHGVDPETARHATSELDETDAAYRLAAKRMRSLAAADYRAFRDRLAGHLQRRGFAWDTIRRTIDRCWREQRGDDAAGESDADIE
jgi:regulatory protein